MNPPQFRNDGSRRCIFCGAGDLSLEDIWPKWISRLLPRKHAVWHAGQFRMFDPPTEQPKVTGRAWKKKRLETTAKVVCKSCNNGWMSGIENNTIPILKNLILGSTRETTLTAEDQRTLAIWVTLRWMVYETQLEGGSVQWFFTTDERHAFMENPEPPPDALIWIGAAELGLLGAHMQGHSATSPAGVGAYGEFTGFVGRFAFQCVCRRDGRQHNLDRAESLRWRSSTIRVWLPATDAVMWPPPLGLDGELMNQFMARFIPVRETGASDRNDPR